MSHPGADAPDRVAIIGVACRYPDAADYDELWANLRAGRSSIHEVSAAQWPQSAFYSATPMESGTINTKWAGTLAGSDRFDHAFFGLSPREAIAVDPQYRLLMEEAWRCIEDACVPIDLLRAKRTSVNVGVMAQDYLIRGVSTNKRVDAFDPIGNYACMGSNRVSFALDLNGPSRTVDTACSASLVALSLARSDLLYEGCDFALVGGVNLIGSPWRYLAFAQSRMLSPDGRSHTFDARANGYVPGEGVGMLLLTKCETARALGCHVYGVVRGIATNHNGRNRNLTAPSVAAQVDVLRRALDAAQVSPGDVDYVEAHGTGTSLGDPVEVEALDTVYGDGRAAPLYVGSIKTNIGHVEAGAGIAGILKVLLMLRARTIAPTRNRTTTNPLIRGEGTTIAFADEAIPWPRERGGARIAGVSSFGFGGVNAHAILEEHLPAATERADRRADAGAVFTLAAKSPSALFATLAAWVDGPLARDGVDVTALCRASNQRCTSLPVRYAFAPRSAADLRADIARFVARGEVRDAEATPLAAALIEPSGDHAPSADGAIGRRARALLEVLLASPAVAAALERKEAGADVRATCEAIASLRALEDLGVTFAEIAAQGRTTILAALAYAGAITVEAAARALIDDAETVVVGAPPSRALLLGRAALAANALSDDYLRALLDGVAHGDAAAPYLARARVLLDHQHTFARAIARWEPLLAARGVALADAIRGVERSAPPSAAAAKAVTLAIDHALVELHEAWQLRPAAWLHAPTHELARLVRAGALDGESVVRALFGEVDVADLARAAEERPAVRTRPLDLEALRARTARERRGAAIPLPRRGEVVPFAPLRAEAVVAIGAAADAALPSPAIATLASATDEALRATLARLWTGGHSIAWWRLDDADPVRLPGLPTYRFDPHVHLHSDEGMRIDGRPPWSAAAAPSAPEPPATRDRAAIDAAPIARAVVDGPGGLDAADRSDATALADRLEALLLDLVAQATKIDRARLRADTPFADLGIDSLIIHGLTSALRQRFGEVSPVLFFEQRNVRGVCERVAADHRAAVAAHFGRAPAPTRAPSTADAPSAPRQERPATTPSARTSSDARDAIAIIGVHARFPGADSIDELWRNLCDGHDAITEIPASRWDHALYFDPRRGVPGKVYARWGGFLSAVDEFDAAAFKLSAADARFMDPQERLFLESVRGCLEVAGYTKRRLREAVDGRVGVFAGATFNNYQLLQLEATLARGDAGAPVNSQTYAIANRASYVFDFRGPSLTLDTACSSSLYAVHLACESLRRGECAMAVAGGVNLSLHPSKYQMLAEYQFLSSDGRCRAFGDGGDGYVPAEAVGAFLLKPAEAAARDGDRVYAVIRGSAVTHGGRTNGFTVPSPDAQTRAIAAALEQARVDPATITYVEAHGTGTRLGDPIEIAALTAAYRRSTDRRQYCAIGSIKSNIGHAEAAAGVAQLAKVLLQMEEGYLVPSLLHAERTNPSIDFASTPFFVQRAFEAWDTAKLGLPGAPLRAGITSIGAGGVNVHLVVEKARST